MDDGVLDAIRFVLYALDFIFGVVCWGITADFLDGCKLARVFKTGETCDAIIALGVIAMLALIAVVVLRILDRVGTFSFSEIVETVSFAAMTLLWFILAIITLASSSSASRQVSQVNGVIAGAWMALLTHSGSTAVSVLSYRSGGKE